MSSAREPAPSGPLSSGGARIGLTFIAQSACISFIAVVSLLGYVSYLTWKNRDRTPEWRLIRSHLDLYLLGLLVSDLIQATGGMMDIKWIAMAGVYEGGFCTAQGVIKQFGDVGVALCSLAIAVHTFSELVLRWKEPPTFTIPIVVLCTYVTFLTLIIGIAYGIHRNENYYGDTIYWCWITSRFLTEGIVLEYMWFWIAALANFVLYVPIALALKGIITVEPSVTWLRYRVRRIKRDERQVFPKGEISPWRMLLYPAVYIVTVLPLSISRIGSLAHPGHEVPFPATVFAGVLFSASGIFNVIVYTITRPALLRPSAVGPADAPQMQRNAKAPQLFWSGADEDIEVRSMRGFFPSMSMEEPPVELTMATELRTDPDQAHDDLDVGRIGH